VTTLAPDHFVPATVDRKFWAIFALSLALHAAALFWSRNPIVEAPPLMPTIIASLRLIAPPAEPQHVAKVIPDLRPTPKPAPVAQPVARRPAAPERLAIHRATEAASPTVTPIQPNPAPAAIEPPPPPVPVTTVAKAAPQVSEAPAAAAQLQVNLLAAYRQHLTEIFAGQQQYPRVAALRGWEGEVRLRLRVARKGNLVAFQLDHSSGFDVLDQHALAIIEQLAKLPPLPDGLNANEIQVVVPINYKLKKTT
jgi:periplasmic protein TonB